jgi:hypothetical protein
VTTDAGRLAAYADLVAAVLDLRPATTREAFDKAIVDGLSSGTITDDLARQLRWLQRQNERAMVEHAESVLPPALVALDRSAADALSPVSSVLQTASPEPSAGTEAATDPVIDPVTSDLDDLPDDEPGAVVNLQARRLLVAGLRPIAHSHSSGVDTAVPHSPSLPADPGH